MRPTILPTLYASSYHLAAEQRSIQALTEIAEEVGIFSVSGSDEAIHISILNTGCLPNDDIPLPLDLRKLIEYAYSQDVFELCLAPEEQELPGLSLYEDDYIYSFAIYAKIEFVTKDGKHQTHTCSFELEPQIFIDHRIFEEFRTTCVKYAEKKLDANTSSITFISKARYDEINARENCKTTLNVSFDDNGYAVHEEG